MRFSKTSSDTVVGPFAQERPVSRLNVVRSKVYDGVRRLAVTVRDSIIRHGRFLILNRDRSRLCSFLWVRATIERAISLVKEIIARRNSFCGMLYFGP
jgi:hypothetical protein